MKDDKVYLDFFSLTQEEVNHMDNLITKRLQCFSYPGCHRASLEHFLETGKISGTFRTELHGLLMEYLKSKSAIDKNK